ncbi:hypothetical protein MRX96_004122 [Rhipicephalus microplus]
MQSSPRSVVLGRVVEHVLQGGHTNADVRISLVPCNSTSVEGAAGWFSWRGTGGVRGLPGALQLGGGLAFRAAAYDRTSRRSSRTAALTALLESSVAVVAMSVANLRSPGARRDWLRSERHHSSHSGVCCRGRPSGVGGRSRRRAGMPR